MKSCHLHHPSPHEEPLLIEKDVNALSRTLLFNLNATKLEKKMRKVSLTHRNVYFLIGMILKALFMMIGLLAVTRAAT